ncbi:MAG: diguanylate cyclase [Colwellia sp.]|nr:diguanylate cyclase [Colwellia sp.]
MINITRLISVVLLLLLIVTSFKANAIRSVVEVEQINIAKTHLVVDYLSIASAKSSSIKSAEVHQLTNEQWQEKQSISSGFEVVKGTNWFAINLSNSFGEPRSVYLTFKNRFQLIDVQLYQLTKEKKLNSLTFHLNSSSLKSVLINLPALSTSTVYLKVESDANLKLPIQMISERFFYQYTSEAQYDYGFVIGGMMLIALVMLLLFFASGLKSILLISGYFLTRALLLSVILGGNLLYLFPELPELRAVDLPLLTAASLIFLLLFTLELFNLKEALFSYYQRIKYLCWLLFISIFVSLFLGVHATFIMSLSFQGLVSFALIILGIVLIKKSQPLAKLFTLTAVIQCLFLMFNVIILQINGLATIEYQSAYFGFFFWLNAFLIIFILSRQYAYQLRGKQQIQRQALESVIAAKQANEELLALQKDNQEELEVHVQERTLELHIALQELESSNRELELKNTQDDLTGLSNRRFYDKKILAEYRRSKRNLTPLSLVLIDIDHFKRVNDTHGHLAGDQCLKWFGQKIKASLKRSTDMGCRYGGEEFCLILPDTDAEGALALAEALRLSISDEPCNYQDLAINLTISCGISTYLQQDNVQPEQIFSGADEALYRAKKDGRNQTLQHDFSDQ